MIEVTVRGPGGTISVEAEIIRRALAAFGFSVYVEDEHAMPADKVDDIMEKVRSSRTLRAQPIRLKVAHLPWGG